MKTNANLREKFMTKRNAAAMLIAVLSTLALAVPALAAVNSLSSGAAHRAAGRYAHTLGMSIQDGSNVTLDGTAIDQCYRVNLHKFSCHITMDFAQDDGSVIHCTAVVFPFTTSRSKHVFVESVPSSSSCNLLS